MEKEEQNKQCWIETRALFFVKNEANELMGLDTGDEFEFDLFSFDARDISAFNPATDRELTTIRLKSGDAFNIEMNYAEFKQTLRKALEE